MDRRLAKIFGLFSQLWLILNFSALAGSVKSEPITPLPLEVNVPDGVVKLGRRLFFEKKLSRDNSVSCSSCHRMNHGGADDRAMSIGVHNSVGDINAPTVFNSANNFVQFWDGRAADLEAQIDGPTHHPKEMGSNWNEIVKKLNDDESYRSDFKTVFQSEPKPELIRQAIAAFEKSLSTPHSRFDQYLMGEDDAITPKEKEGYKLFKNFGCISCHQGRNIGGNLFQKMGVMGDYFKDRGNENQHDWGRFNVTRREEDKYFFKVPSLRNVELTAPYFHDGSAKTLSQAVIVMGKYQLGRTISPREASLIVEFLKTLSGQLPDSLEGLKQ